MKQGFFAAAGENLSFVAVCIAVVAAMVAIAYGIEKGAQKKSGEEGRILSTRKIVMIGMFSAIAGILYCFDFALPIAPSFYKLDFSELPALIGGFAFGPVAGVLIEFLKVLIKLLLKSTSTAFVGDLANFLIGSMLVLPASVVYRFRKGRTAALMGCIAGTLIMTVFGTAFNAIYLLPAFSKLYGMPLDVILGMGTAINAGVKDIWSFVLLMVAPINLIKGTLVSVLTMLLYKKLTPIIR
ncbi:MAG: ECF transporter S component, partial [Lachnospiraceae bacterium]|nr:ECF transporter S component [Lachnospiraceae bacterium]